MNAPTLARRVIDLNIAPFHDARPILCLELCLPTGSRLSGFSITANLDGMSDGWFWAL
jgi:hypothetical protein